MDLFFTPVQGKKAMVDNWPNQKFTKEEALKLRGNTGCALVHSLSSTVALDFDDLKKCISLFRLSQIDLIDLIKDQYQIVSPKANRLKVICYLPSDIDLEYISLPVSTKKPILELRCGNRYDVWCNSEHPDGGKYKHVAGSSAEIKVLPPEIAAYWMQCLAHKSKEIKATGNLGKVPLYSNGKISVIHLYNVKYPLEKILKDCGYKNKGHKWQSPHSDSGAYGLTTQQSYLNPWQVCYSHHASDGELSGRPIDAFEIAASFCYPDKDLNTAKLIFTSDQAKVLNAVDSNYKSLNMSADSVNNPQPATPNLSALIHSTDENKKAPPTFDESIISDLPDPMPLLLKNFKECIYDPVPAMFGPAFMALHETLLQAKIRTIRDRSVNCSYANGSLSGGGKDDNSIEATHRYYKQFKTVNLLDTSTPSAILSKLLCPITSTFTSGTNLLQTFHSTFLNETDKKPLGGVVMNAESTGFYRTLADTNNQYSGKAIIDAEIACFNGQLIPAAKITSDSKKHMEDIINPNFSFFRLTQLDPFKKAFNLNLVESGYYGRLFETFDIRDNDKYVPSGNINDKVFKFDDRGFKFILFLAKQIHALKAPIQVKSNTPGSPINMWDIEVLGKKIYNKISPELFAGIKRIPQIAEKWVAMITAYHYFWLLYTNKSVDHLIIQKNEKGEIITLDGTSFESSVLNMMTYLVDVKWFTLHSYVVCSEASALDEILERLWADCVHTKKSKTYGPWLAEGMVPYQMFADKVKKKKDIQDIVPDVEKINRIIATFIKNKGLKVSNSAIAVAGSKSKKTCICEVFSI